MFRPFQDPSQDQPALTARADLSVSTASTGDEMHKDWAQREHPDLPALDVLKRYFFRGGRHLRGASNLVGRLRRARAARRPTVWRHSSFWSMYSYFHLLRAVLPSSGPPLLYTFQS